MLDASQHQSFWKGYFGQERPYFPRLDDTLTADVCVVGGGITGLTTAYKLSREGWDVVLLEAGRLGGGTTGQSSAHLDPLGDMFLQNVLVNFGENKARRLINANRWALEWMEEQICAADWNCDFRRTSGVRFTENDWELDFLDGEARAAQEMGLIWRWANRSEIPWRVEGAIRFKEQARFNPVKYLWEMVRSTHANGARIYENTPCTALGGKIGHNCLSTPSGEVTASRVVLATHTPVGAHYIWQSRIFAYRSYMLGVVLQEPGSSDDLYWDTTTPYHYLGWETSPHNEQVLLIGGADHRVGETTHTKQSYRHLENFVHSRFEVRRILFHWSAQYYETADGLPFIGGARNTYFATGFSGNGLVYGTLAGLVTAKKIMGESVACAPLFSPFRFQSLSAVKNLFQKNMQIAETFIRDRLSTAGAQHMATVNDGQGQIVELSGEKYAVYRDQKGELFVLSPVCPHDHCLVHWNSVEESWDCPGHGSRFDATGELIEGPALHSLKRHYLFVQDQPEPAVHPSPST